MLFQPSMILYWYLILPTYQNLANAHNDYLGPKNLSPLKCIMWSGVSTNQTSVSQAILFECFLNSTKSGNAVTYTFPALQSFKNSSNSTIRFGETGPWEVTASIKNNQFLLESYITTSGNL